MLSGKMMRHSWRNAEQSLNLLNETTIPFTMIGFEAKSLELKR